MKTTTYDETQWQLVPRALSPEMASVLTNMLTDCHSVQESYRDLLYLAPEHPAAEVGIDIYDAALKLMAANAQRAAFDAWWEDHGCLVRSGGGQYERSFAWEAWNYATVAAAARRQTLSDHFVDANKMVGHLYHSEPDHGEEPQYTAEQISELREWASNGDIESAKALLLENGFVVSKAIAEAEGGV